MYFQDFIIDSYVDICEQFFENDLKQFYIPSKQVPDPPQEWVNAFQNKSLKSLNLDVESFKQRLGLWRILNIDISKTKKIKKRDSNPLLPTVTINPLTHTIWNLFKGGGNTIIKLIDNVQEGLGIQSDSNAASPQLLLYFAIEFHRGNQWCHVKEDLTFYPALAHARNANNKRKAINDTLQAVSTMLKSQASAAALETPTAGLDGVAGQTIQLQSLTIPETSEDNGRRRKTRKSMNATPDPVQMPIVGIKTGRTPVRQTKANKDEIFQERYDNCLGMFYGQVVPDPKLGAQPKTT